MKPYGAREGNKQIKLAGFQNQHRYIAILTSIASTDIEALISWAL